MYNAKKNTKEKNNFNAKINRFLLIGARKEYSIFNILQNHFGTALYLYSDLLLLFY